MNNRRREKSESHRSHKTVSQRQTPTRRIIDLVLAPQTELDLFIVAVAWIQRRNSAATIA